MLILRTSLCFALGLSINTVLASGHLEPTSAYQGKQQSPLGEKLDSRRRTAGECDIPPNVWAVNILCETAPFCYLAQEEVRLWLPEEKRLGLKALVIKTRKPIRQKAELHWPASAETQPWPVEQMPIQSGVPHRMELKTRQGSSLRKTITLYQIPVEYRNTTAEQAQWMAQRGCTQQADMRLQEQQVQKTAPVEATNKPTSKPPQKPNCHRRTDSEKPAEVSLPPAN